MPTWARVDAAALDTSAPNEHRMSESPARVVLQTFRRTRTSDDCLLGGDTKLWCALLLRLPRKNSEVFTRFFLC
jgi:hypothetical protein